MRLPKLYAPVMLRFSTLRGYISESGGYSEIDVVVERKARRVIGKYGWSWQLVVSPLDLKYNCGNFSIYDLDHECLNGDREDCQIV